MKKINYIIILFILIILILNNCSNNNILSSSNVSNVNNINISILETYKINNNNAILYSIKNLSYIPINEVDFSIFCHLGLLYWETSSIPDTITVNIKHKFKSGLLYNDEYEERIIIPNIRSIISTEILNIKTY
jgi:hypothetical protein